MQRKRDIVEVEGVRTDGPAVPDGPEPGGPLEVRPPTKPFLMIWFRCCATYARLPKAPDGRRYAGQCPKCRARLEVPVGEGGTTRRMFEAS